MDERTLRTFVTDGPDAEHVSATVAPSGLWPTSPLPPKPIRLLFITAMPPGFAKGFCWRSARCKQAATCSRLISHRLPETQEDN
jgi:hypothetical protein